MSTILMDSRLFSGFKIMDSRFKISPIPNTIYLAIGDILNLESIILNPKNNPKKAIF